MLKRCESIDWCVKHISTWPRTYKGIVSTPSGWAWFNFGGEMSLVNKWEKPIHKTDWVHFINEPHNDCASVF